MKIIRDELARRVAHGTLNGPKSWFFGHLQWATSKWVYDLPKGIRPIKEVWAGPRKQSNSSSWDSRDY